MNVVLGKKPPSDVSAQNCSVLRLPDTYACSDRVSFSLWLLVHLAQLSGYTEEGRYVGTGSGRVRISLVNDLRSVLTSSVIDDHNQGHPTGLQSHSLLGLWRGLTSLIRVLPSDLSLLGTLAYESVRIVTKWVYLDICKCLICGPDALQG